MTDTIDQQFRATAAAEAARPAVDDGETELTYAALNAAADAAARSLAAAGLEAHEPVVALVAHRAADVAAFLAIWRAGGVVVPIHRSQPKAAFRGLCERLGNRFVLDGGLATLSRPPPARRALLDGAGTIIFTSGSTGAPKGVVLAADRARAKLAMIQAMTGWRAGENALIGLQLTFSFGQWATWLTLLNGGTVHLRGRFDAAEVHGLVASGAIRRYPAVPTMLRHLLDRGGGAFAGRIMAGGEPLAAALGRRVREAYPAAGLGDIYGLTETGTSDFFVRPEDYDSLAGTIGRAGDGIQWRIDAGSQELEIRSPWRMRGYLDAPEETARALRDGWFRTGDLASADATGAVRLIGRAGDQINRAGNKISPLEVEAAFLDHADVAAALAAGAADPDRGQAVHLAVVLRPGADVAAAALTEWAAERLARYQLPDAIHFVDELPSGATGKADRRALRRLIETGGLS